MAFLVLLALACLVATVSARAIAPMESVTDQCGDLTGYWVNELNSEMYITVGSNGQLIGQYGTAVETSTGAAGNGKQSLTGRVVGSAITFNVAWNGGERMTAWIGQCYQHKENDKPQPIISVMWILKTVATNIDNNWMTNSIGFDTFYRKA